MPVAADTAHIATELQQSIFGAPPSSLPAPVSLSSNTKSTEVSTDQGKTEVDKDGDGKKGIKRAREDESDDDEGAPMEEDSDAPMEASDDEDE